MHRIAGQHSASLGLLSVPGLRRGSGAIGTEQAGLDARFHDETFVNKEAAMLGTVLLIVLVVMLLGAYPAWPHSRGWGYGPSGGLGLVLAVLVVLLLMGRI